LYASQLAYFGFFLKVSVLHRMEKLVDIVKILKKVVRDMVVRCGSARAKKVIELSYLKVFLDFFDVRTIALTLRF